MEEFEAVGSIEFENMLFKCSTVVADEDTIKLTKSSKGYDERMRIVHGWK